MTTRSIELQRKLERIAYWEEQGQVLREEEIAYEDDNDWNFPVTYEDFQR